MTAPKEIDLWEWQDEAVEAMRENIRNDVPNQILVAPTGSGKTITSAYLIDEARKKGKRCFFICDRISLIDQTSAVFDEYGIDHGVIQAKHWRWKPWAKVQIASAQTLARRTWPEDIALIVVDEAHTVHKTVADRISKRDTVTIGLTATPFTKGLGKLYDSVVNVRTLNQLTADGKLCPFQVYAAVEPDMTDARVVAGEWTDDAAEKAAMPIIGDAVKEYLKHAPGQKFIAFGVNVRHCEELQKQFLEAGVQTGLYTHLTPDDERTAMVQEFKQRGGYIQGLISVAALSKGFDVPAVECIIMCRPLRSSLTEHIQILGRGLRMDPENPDKVCTVLDHAGNMMRFWYAMNEYFENGVHELDDGKRKPKKAAKDDEERVKKCPMCSHVHSPRPTCPMCGHEYPKPAPIEHVPGELKAMAAGIAANVSTLRQDVYSQLLHVAQVRKYKEVWARHRFKELFGAWPNGLDDTPRPATPRTLSWITERQIAWAREKQKAERQAAAS